MDVPYVDLPAQHSLIKNELLEAVSQVLDHGMFILGQEVEEFERQFAELCEVRYAVGVNSGTDALILALKVLGIGPGDEVITVVNSFVASASCITLVGAVPVLVDVRDDMNIDPALIEAAITAKTKALLPVHMTGRPADMEQIMDIARRHNLFVVEDCAQAIGAKHNGRIVGSMGDIGCFSLHPLKTLNACGDGGIITTNDPTIHQELKYLRNHGLQTRENCIIWGQNSRLDTIQAAILLVKMKYFEEWTEKRRNNARFYQEHLAEVEELQLPTDNQTELAVYHTFVVLASQRDRLKEYLASKGVRTVVSYPKPIHLQPAAAALPYRSGSFPIAEQQAERMLNLPIHGELKADQLEYVVDNIQNFYAQVN
jgi:dTDP-4-amino-4,6-dideoxygalactose transaminase